MKNWDDKDTEAKAEADAIRRSLRVKNPRSGKTKYPRAMLIIRRVSKAIKVNKVNRKRQKSSGPWSKE